MVPICSIYLPAIGIFFFNRNGQFFNLMSKFYIVCVNFLPEIGRFMYRKWSFYQIIMYKFFPEFVYFSTGTYFFNRNLYNFQIWSRIVRFFSKDVAYFFNRNGPFFYLKSKFCLVLVDLGQELLNIISIFF